MIAVRKLLGVVVAVGLMVAGTQQASAQAVNANISVSCPAPVGGGIAVGAWILTPGGDNSSGAGTAPPVPSVTINCNRSWTLTLQDLSGTDPGFLKANAGAVSGGVAVPAGTKLFNALRARDAVTAGYVAINNVVSLVAPATQPPTASGGTVVTFVYANIAELFDPVLTGAGNTYQTTLTLTRTNPP